MADIGKMDGGNNQYILHRYGHQDLVSGMLNDGHLILGVSWGDILGLHGWEALDGLHRKGMDRITSRRFPSWFGLGYLGSGWFWFVKKEREDTLIASVDLYIII